MWIQTGVSNLGHVWPPLTFILDLTLVPSDNSHDDTIGVKNSENTIH